MVKKIIIIIIIIITGSLNVLHISSLDRWMTMNRLKLNADKTQLIWLDTRQQLAKLTVTQFQLCCVVEFQSVVTDLGAVYCVIVKQPTVDG